MLLAGHFHSLVALAHPSSALCLVVAGEVLADSEMLLGAAQAQMQALIGHQSWQCFLTAGPKEQAEQRAAGACVLLL